MAISYGFFNSVDGDRKYNASQIGRYLQYIVSDGVYAYDSTSLQVLANDGMEVAVQAGRAMLDHHYMENDEPITLTLSAGGSQDRIDAIVMYVDLTERACGIAVKEGTPAAAPTRPALTRTDVRKEYMLASVYVTKLVSSITQANITDTRADTTVCGWVSGLISQVDTSTLFNQWQAAYEEAYEETQDYLAAQKAAWDAFFAAVAEDNLVPIPNVDAIGYVVRVNSTGDGYILSPTQDVLSYKVTLTASGWEENRQTVTATGLTADETQTDVMASPDPADSENRTSYMDNDVYIIQQLDGAVVFACSSVPDRDLIVNVAVTIKGETPSGVSYPDGDEVAYG